MPFVVVALPGYGIRLAVSNNPAPAQAPGLSLRQIEADHIGGLCRKIRVIALAPAFASGQIDLLLVQGSPNILHINVAQSPRNQWPVPAGKPLGRRLVENLANALVSRLAVDRRGARPDPPAHQGVAPSARSGSKGSSNGRRFVIASPGFDGLQAAMGQSGKIIELEALRGIAAIVVLVHHFMLGFAPRLHGLLYPEQPQSIFGTPMFAFVNGSAAVIVFFVLSGFVLTVRIFQTGQVASGIMAAVKRWPRLAATVVISNVFAGGLMAMGVYINHSVAPEVPSIWLGWFYGWPSAGTSEIGRAMSEGAMTFFTGASTYNSNLWTMYYEFTGSLVAIGGAIACLYVPHRWRRFLLSAILAAIFYKVPLLSPFIAGAWLAMRHTESRLIRPTWLFVLIAPIILCLIGYHENLISHRAEGWYAFLNPLVAVGPIYVRVALHTIGAAAIVMTFLYAPTVRRWTSGAFGARLGFISFAIYLVQIPIICSMSALTFRQFSEVPHPIQLSVTFAVTLVGTIMVAIPLAVFDKWWMTMISRAAVRTRESLANVIAATSRRDAA